MKIIRQFISIFADFAFVSYSTLIKTGAFLNNLKLIEVAPAHKRKKTKTNMTIDLLVSFQIFL